LQLSDTDNNLKLSKGDFVNLKQYSRVFPDSDGIWKVTFTGKVIDYEVGVKEPIYIGECYSSNLRFTESSLKHNNPDDERDWKLKQLLK